MKKFLALLVLILGVAAIAMFMKAGKTENAEGNIITPVLQEDSDQDSPDTLEKSEGNTSGGDISDGDTSDGNTSGGDSSAVKELIDSVKIKSENGQLNSLEGVKEALEEAEEKLGASISDQTKDEIAKTVIELENLGFSSDIIIEKTEDLYEEYGSDFVNHLEEAFTEAVKDAAENAANNMVESIEDAIKEKAESFKNND